MIESPLSDEFTDNLIKNVLSTWIAPELNRREALGKVPVGFVLYAGQVLMEPGHPAEVRLNEEVRGVFGVRPEAAIQDGEFLVADFGLIAAEVQSFILEEDDRSNAGHITMVHSGRGWFVSFDLRYNAARIAQYLATIQEYLDSATANLGGSRLRALVADLFVAVELMAKARLMVHPDERLLASKKHTFTATEFNRLTKRGGMDSRFAALLNDLTELRNPARYPDAPFTLALDTASSMLGIAREMWTALLPNVPLRALSLAKLDGRVPPPAA